MWELITRCVLGNSYLSLQIIISDNETNEFMNLNVNNGMVQLAIEGDVSMVIILEEEIKGGSECGREGIITVSAVRKRVGGS